MEEELVVLLPRLRRFARTLCRDADTADDLVQAACERALNAAASLRSQEGDHLAALALQDQALALLEPSGGAWASVLNNRAAALDALGRYAEASAAYEQVLAEEQRIYGPLHARVAVTLGNLGLVTMWIHDLTGFRLQSTGFSLYSMGGLIVVYLFFQFPLMLLVIAPSIEGLRREWQEAAQNLGATPRQYWRRVAFPILTPSILGAGILLFGNAFGAQATSRPPLVCGSVISLRCHSGASAASCTASP